MHQRQCHLRFWMWRYEGRSRHRSRQKSDKPVRKVQYSRTPTLCEKHQFKSPSVTFMGHKLTDKGVEPNPSKVVALTQMPTPTDKAGVQRFLGMYHYLSKFCPNFSETLLPLRDLTKEDSTFPWSNNHENAFLSAKTLIASATALRDYDPSRDGSSKRISRCHRWGIAAK